MSTDIVKYKWQDKDIALTKSDVRNLISTDPKVTDKEIALFMQLCKYQNLNPFVREVYLVKYGTYPASMVVGKEVFTKRAEQNKDFDGYEITDNFTAKLPLEEFEVTCKVFKKSIKHAITVTVSYPEYVGTDSKGNVNRMWKGKPRTMLRKVALMQGLREAFPTALGGLYEENELDQRAVPKDITPKFKHEGEAIPLDDARDDVENVKDAEIKDEVNREVNREDEAIDEVEAIEQEQGIENDRDREQVEMEFEPASTKQKDYIYGTEESKGIVDSDYITKEEVKRIGKSKDLSKEKASKIMKWWWDDKSKNIIGERSKREKSKPKLKQNKGNALEKRGALMQEVLDLMKENHIKEAEKKKMYAKYQKKQIQQLATEELEELKVMLENYVPDWS